MVHRIALFAASLAAALVIAGGLALAGLGPQQPAADAVVVMDQVAAPTDAVAPEATVQVDTIYLTPQATPEQITVTKVQVAAKQGGEADESGEGGDD